MTELRTLIVCSLVLALGACSNPADDPNPDAPPAPGEPAADGTAQASAPPADEEDWTVNELPVRKIPNIPESAEAYYAPDSLHVIAQTQDPRAREAQDERSAGGALTWIYKDDGSEYWAVGDEGQDACSWFMPDGERIVWTSTRDNLDMPTGNWSDDSDYPQGAELYMSDVKGENVTRLTNNEYYDAEVSASPDGKLIVFGRQIDGKMDLWLMNADGTNERQLTFTDDWQEGAPFFLPDNETILYRAWQRSVTSELKKRREETGRREQTPMTVFTIKKDGTDTQVRSFTDDMNWAPFPAPDGRHYVFVRIVDGGNWDIFLGDLAGGEPRRLTWNPSFDGFPSISPDGTKMLFTRSAGDRFMSDLYTHVMDISTLNIGPGNYEGVPAAATPPEGWEMSEALAAAVGR